MTQFLRPDGAPAAFFAQAVTSGHLGHAYLLEGAKGAGKKTLARFCAALVLCQTQSACGICPACRQLQANANPDLVWVDAGGKATLPIAAVRELLKEVSVRPANGEKRVFVIDEAEKMNAAAQNALLKAMEEPPGYALFLLLCENAAILLPTIRSRTQHIRIPPLPESALHAIAPDLPKEHIAFSYCGGNPGKLQELLYDTDFQALREELYKKILLLFGEDDFIIYHIAAFYEAHKERREDLFALTLLFLRDGLLLKLGAGASIVNADCMPAVETLARLAGKQALLRMIEIIIKTEKELGKYGNFPLAVQTMLIDCREAIHD